MQNKIMQIKSNKIKKATIFYCKHANKLLIYCNIQTCIAFNDFYKKELLLSTNTSFMQNSSHKSF